MTITFITGGARSGKSTLGEKLARERGDKVVYIATAQALDAEMAHRIKLHQDRRPKNWTTLEEPKYLAKTLEQIRKDKGYTREDVVLIDCLALFVSNWLPLEETEESSAWGLLRSQLLNQAKALLEEAKKMEAQLIIVTNEVGLGLVPEYPLGRLYRDLLGEVNQLVAALADEAYFLVSGIPMKLK